MGCKSMQQSHQFNNQVNLGASPSQSWRFQNERREVQQLQPIRVLKNPKQQGPPMSQQQQIEYLQNALSGQDALRSMNQTQMVMGNHSQNARGINKIKQCVEMNNKMQLLHHNEQQKVMVALNGRQINALPRLKQTQSFFSRNAAAAAGALVSAPKSMEQSNHKISLKDADLKQFRAFEHHEQQYHEQSQQIPKETLQHESLQAVHKVVRKMENGGLYRPNFHQLSNGELDGYLRKNIVITQSKDNYQEAIIPFLEQRRMSHQNDKVFNKSFQSSPNTKTSMRRKGETVVSKLSLQTHQGENRQERQDISTDYEHVLKLPTASSLGQHNKQHVKKSFIHNKNTIGLKMFQNRNPVMGQTLTNQTSGSFAFKNSVPHQTSKLGSLLSDYNVREPSNGQNCNLKHMHQSQDGSADSDQNRFCLGDLSGGSQTIIANGRGQDEGLLDALENDDDLTDNDGGKEEITFGDIPTNEKAGPGQRLAYQPNQPPISQHQRHVNTDLDILQEIKVERALKNPILIETQFPQIPAKTPESIKVKEQLQKSKMPKTNITNNNQKLKLLEQFISQIEPEAEKGSTEMSKTKKDEDMERVDRSYSSKHSMGKTQTIKTQNAMPLHQQQIYSGQIDRQTYQKWQNSLQNRRSESRSCFQSTASKSQLTPQGLHMLNVTGFGKQQSFKKRQQEIVQQPQYQISSTLFVMDCQTLGLLDQQFLFKQMATVLDSQRKIRAHLSERQIVDFVIERVQLYNLNHQMSGPQFQLPKLGQEAKTIINTIKAQRQLSMPHEIKKLDTLIIEMEYQEFKDSALIPLYKHLGQDVLENIKPNQQASFISEEHKFQNINEFISKIKRYHEESAKFANKILFNNINDHSSDEEVHDVPSAACEFELPEIGNEFTQTQCSGFSRNKILKTPRKDGKQYMRASQIQYSKYLPPEEPIEMISTLVDETEQPQNSRSRNSNRNRMSTASLQILGLRKAPDGTASQEHSRSKQAAKNGGSTLQEQEKEEKLSKYAKKLFKNDDFNLQIFIKHTVLHESLLRCDEKQKVSNAEQFLEMAGATKHQTASELSFINELSSFIHTKDCSILKFAIFCSQIGVIDNPCHILRQLFSNVFIMVRNYGGKDDDKEEEMHRMHLLNVEMMRNRKGMTRTHPHTVSNQHLAGAGNSTSIERKTTATAATGATPDGGAELNKSTLIKIYHQPYKHLQKSKINKCFEYYNQFIQLTFKNKAFFLPSASTNQKQSLKQSEIDQLYRIASIFQIPLPKKPLKYNANIPDIMDFLKVPKNVCTIKEMLLRYKQTILNKENGMSQNMQDYILHNKSLVVDSFKEKTIQNQGHYTFQVGSGNNHMLIKSLLKQRWWLFKAQPFEEVQILWTQWRKIKKCEEFEMSANINSKYKRLLEMIEHDHFDDFVDVFCEYKESPSKDEAVQDNSSVPAGGDLLGSDGNLELKMDSCIQTLRQLMNSLKSGIQKIYNKLESNHHLNNKKALFLNMSNYYKYCCEDQDVFDTLPLTFHIRSGLDDVRFKKFKEQYEADKLFNEEYNQNNSQHKMKNVWVIKPGENSNRGTGIMVETKFANIVNEVQNGCQNGRTIILQKYISNPLLYKNRKFDIRCFSLVTSINGHIKAYFYKNGYIRTASKEYTLNQNQLHNKFIHLVNDAVQKHSEDYGKHETANKLSYADFQKFLSSQYAHLNINFERDILSQVQKIVTDTIRATFHLLDTRRRINSYELFGYDFMFDREFRPYLIEVNSNPSLECSSSLLSKLFHDMLENTFAIAIDPLFPGPPGFTGRKAITGVDICPLNQFELIFDERTDGPDLLEKLQKIDPEELLEIETSILNEANDIEEQEEIMDGNTIGSFQVKKDDKKKENRDGTIEKKEMEDFITDDQRSQDGYN